MTPKPLVHSLSDNGRVFTTPDVSLNIPEGVLQTKSQGAEEFSLN